jgi:vacuolar-type H+-ATPase subunit H
MESQEEYVKSLKQIKEAEERVQVEIDARRKAVQEELQNLQVTTDTAVKEAEKEGERMEEMETERARQRAQAEAQKILEDSKAKATTISAKRVDAKNLRTIIEEVLLDRL